MLKYENNPLKIKFDPFQIMHEMTPQTYADSGLARVSKSVEDTHCSLSLTHTERTGLNITTQKRKGFSCLHLSSTPKYTCTYLTHLI